MNTSICYKNGVEYKIYSQEYNCDIYTETGIKKIYPIDSGALDDYPFTGGVEGDTSVKTYTKHKANLPQEHSFIGNYDTFQSYGFYVGDTSRVEGYFSVHSYQQVVDECLKYGLNVDPMFDQMIQDHLNKYGILDLDNDGEMCLLNGCICSIAFTDETPSYYKIYFHR